MKNQKLHLVGIGASAGGLAAIKLLVGAIKPLSQKVAYVIVQHLAPDKRSYMKDILTDKVVLPVEVIETGAAIRPGIIYLCPPGKVVSVLAERFVLQEQTEDHSPNRAIDIFLKAIAKEFRERAIGIVLSGSGSDGVRGAQEIYEAGGEVIVQNPEQAEFPSMPESVVQAGFFTRSLDAEDMFQNIQEIVEVDPETKVSGRLYDEITARLDDFSRLFSEQFSVNLRDYKFATVGRRLTKRMLVLKLSSVDDFLNLLKNDPMARVAVFDEVMISVTKFFRDEEFYASLRKTLESMPVPTDSEFRVWSAGCSHGEEAYSLLILLLEVFASRSIKTPIRLFATDINSLNIDFASKGLYSEEALESLKPEVKEWYFEKVRDGYQIKKAYRELVIFSRHDILHSPPFSNMDLAICRNVLIYLTASSQGKALLNLTFSLKIGGVLGLGPSESLGVLQKCFETQDRKWRIFQKKRNADIGLSSRWSSPKSRTSPLLNTMVEKVERVPVRGNALLNIFEHLYTNSLIISETGDLLAVFGLGKKLLAEPHDGLISNSIDQLLTHQAGLIVRAAMSEAHEKKVIVEYENIDLKIPGSGVSEVKSFNLKVRFLESPDRAPHYLCEIVPSKSEMTPTIKREASVDGEASQFLKMELDRTRLELQDVVHQLEVTNEELQTSNEELITANEELQSTNEELNSVNEELYTLNTELQQKIDQVTVANDDLKNLLETTQIGVIYLDLQGNIRKFTHLVEKEFFIRNSDIGRPIFELDFGVFLSKYQELILSCSQQTIKFDLLSKSKDHYNCTVHPYLDLHSRHIGYVLTLVETNEASERESFLNETQSEAKIGGWILDLTTQKTRWTKQIYDIYDIPPSTPTDVAQGLTRYSPRDQEVIMANIKRCAEAGQSFEGVHSLTTAQGKLIWVRVTGHPLFSHDNKVTRIQGTIQDISEAKLADERLRLAMEVSKFGVWEWDFKNENLHWDSRLAALFGLPPASTSLSVDEWLQFAEPEEREELKAKILRAKDSRDNITIDMKARVQGKPRYFRLVARVYEDLSGVPYKMIGVMQDVTVQWIAEREIDEERKVSFQSAKLASLGELAAGVGHEINNPLAIIMGTEKNIMESLKEQNKLTPEIETSFKRSETAGIRIREIVNGLRVFARANPDESSVYSVSAVVEGVMNLVKGIYEKEGVKIEYRPPEKELYFNINFGQIQQALMNLISNARDALENQPIRRIEVVVSEVEGGAVEIMVVDTGHGIPADKMKKIFESFYTTKPVGKGTGLGLSLSKKMIEENGGRIYVDSKVNVGTCFRLTFPLCLDAQRPQLQETQRIATSLDPDLVKSTLVFLVEDEPELRELIQLDLESMGFQVQAYGSPEDALEGLKKKKPDLILTDLQMPEMSGTDFIVKASRILQERGVNASAFVLSGDVSGQKVKELEQMKLQIFKGTINKPYEFDQFKDILLAQVKLVKGK